MSSVSAETVIATYLRCVNNYRKGVRYERKTIQTLTAEGYTCMRSAGSHGLVDVIAWSGRHIRFIQIKCGTARMTPKERAEFVSLPVPAQSTKEIWTYQSRCQPVILTIPQPGAGV